MPNNYLTDFIKQPEQITYNTLYTQKLLEIQEQHLNIPINQYLSQIVNKNLKSIAEGDYLKFKTKNDFNNVTNQNELELKFNSYDNCVLTGFEVGIDHVTNDFITFKVYPGKAIIDTFLIELHEIVTFNVNTTDLPPNYSKIVITLDYIGKSTDDFSIKYYFLNDFNDSIIKPGMHDWRDSLLPLTLFDIVQKESDYYVLALESLGMPFVLFTNMPEKNKIYDAEESLLYQLAKTNIH